MGLTEEGGLRRPTSIDLEVVEVNINVNDVYIPGDDDGTDTGPGRVQ